MVLALLGSLKDPGTAKELRKRAIDEGGRELSDEAALGGMGLWAIKCLNAG